VGINVYTKYIPLGYKMYLIVYKYRLLVTYMLPLVCNTFMPSCRMKLYWKFMHFWCKHVTLQCRAHH